MLVSIVVPVYNEEANILKFYQSITDVMQPLEYDYELIYVDDGSSDRSGLLLQELAVQDSRVKVILLARNFGHQLALTCGLDYAKGDAIVTMDGDLQHPPELVPQLIALWEDGHDIVKTVRDSTEDASWLKNLTSKYYYKLINALSKVRVIEGGSDFRLMNRKSLETFKRFREHGRFLRGIVGDLGYKQAEIHFVAPPRFAGTSKFNIRKMLHFALDGIAAYSKVPLRLAFYVGLGTGFLSLLMILHILYVYFFSDKPVEGWATLGVAIFLLSGVQLISIGIIGEYVGRVFEEVKQRPLYWVRDTYNCVGKDEEVIKKEDNGLI